jgi:hypothetical protein
MRIHHLALRVRDLDAAAAFYSGLLRFPELKRDARSVWLRAGDTVLMLEREIRGKGPESGSGHLLAFAVENVSEWEERLIGAGVPIVDRTSHTLYFQDPDGHRVGLSAYAF